MNLEHEGALLEKTRSSSFLVYTNFILVEERVWSFDTITIAWHFWSTREDASLAVRGCEGTRSLAFGL